MFLFGTFLSTDAGVISKFLGACLARGWLLWRQSVASASVPFIPPQAPASDDAITPATPSKALNTTPIPPTPTNIHPLPPIAHAAGAPVLFGESALLLRPPSPVARVSSCLASIHTPRSMCEEAHRPSGPMPAPSIILHFSRLQYERIADHAIGLQIPASPTYLVSNTLSTSPPHPRQAVRAGHPRKSCTTAIRSFAHRTTTRDTTTSWKARTKAMSCTRLQCSSTS